MKSTHLTRRRATAVIAAAATALLLSVTGCATTDAVKPVSAPAEVPHRAPTVVLVHGADAESSSWHGVIRRLQKRGYPVIAFANPLRGVKTDAANLKDVLSTVKGPIVLVGHSYGGMVISQAAAGNRHVKSLVFVDAHIPVPGETAAELTNKYPGSHFGAALLQRPYTRPNGKRGTDLYVQPAKYRALFTGPRVGKVEALALAAVQRPVAMTALNEPATKAGWRHIPTWDVVGTKDTAIPPATQLFMARRAHAHITRIPAPHASMLTFPGPIAKVIEAASR
jgi:pimeloyl-ACP methyl ester carboxylesterase